MDLRNISHFFYVPDSPSSARGTLHELAPSVSQEGRCVVLCPYVQPEKDPVRPEYFRIVSSQSFSPPNDHTTPPLTLKQGTDKASYLKHLSELKDHIQQGDIYEINYCISFSATGVRLDPFQIFERLRNISRAPYCSLLKKGDDYIICASPELFLRKKGDLLESKPIKGTRRRGMTKQEDEKQKTDLHDSLKERTENVMAVDVARNDLSRLALKGTVKVNKLYNIETFETVHQMVSTVSCRIPAGLTLQEIFEATFPMASMTGAPKIRAMELIGEHEQFQRNHYSGAIGIVEENDDFELAVVIRSIFYNKKNSSLSIAVGSAITHLSDPLEEYNECLLKARGLLSALNAEISN